MSLALKQGQALFLRNHKYLLNWFSVLYLIMVLAIIIFFMIGLSYVISNINRFFLTILLIDCYTNKIKCFTGFKPYHLINHISICHENSSFQHKAL